MGNQNQWYMHRAFGSTNQCKPLDLGCIFKTLIESFWGVVEKNDYSCNFTPMQISNQGLEYKRGMCADPKTGGFKRCQDMKYPFVSTQCRVECGNDGMRMDQVFCKENDIICVCKK